MSADTEKSDHKEFARHYDDEVRAYDSYGHDVIFGMSFDYVKPNEKLLDIGIGTGLASIKFSQIGLKIFGLDSSQDMLSACESKSFTESLNLYDMSKDSIPFEDQYFNHTICCGVLHFLDDLEALFAEVKRVSRKDGIFAFSISPHDGNQNFVKEPTKWGIPIFKHSPRYVSELLESHGFDLLKEQRLLIKGADKIHYDMEFSIMLAMVK